MDAYVNRSPNSGLSSYDGARFGGGLPDTEHVLVDHHGVSVLLQRSGRSREPIEVVVPQTPVHVLIVYRAGIPALTAEVGGRAFAGTLAPGSWAFVPAETPSRWRVPSGADDDILHVHFAPALVADILLRDEGGLRLLEARVDGTDRSVADLAEATLALVVRGEPPPRLAWDSVVTLLVLQLCRSAGDVPAQRPAGALAAPQVRRVVDHLAARLAEDVTLAELAALVGLSPFHFSRAFRKAVGHPPHRYQLLMRVDRAKELLAGTDLAVADIAHAVGCGSAQSLSRLFRSATGTTPTTFRRTARD